MTDEQTLLEDAIALAVAQHRGQVDKAGQPYILHVLRVMLGVTGARERIAAVLHDTVEDTGLPLAVIGARFGQDIADAVAALSRREDEDYAAFVQRCRANPIARRVKLSDIGDNMDLARLGRAPTEEDERRYRKYADAQAELLRD